MRRRLWVSRALPRGSQSWALCGYTNRACVLLSPERGLGFKNDLNHVGSQIGLWNVTQRMEALERRLAERMLADFVRQEKVKAEAPVEPEPKLAVEIVVLEEILAEAEPAAADAEVPVTVVQPEVVVEPKVQLDLMKPPPAISVARMNKFTLKLQAHET